jgi:L-seryl-tRNA(Ser) seleniumtransferase
MAHDLLKPAVNGTGVILHTGLGRAVLSDAARAAVMAMTARYCTLEIDTASGKRGSRHDIVTGLLCELTGAESALVVNNNAAAVLLLLHALARDREVVVSRGQLVEIGGSFRMPDVMAESGARLVSVGAVNHTTIDDYRQAITPHTALLMAVHRSNFEIVGEETSVPIQALATLGREASIPVAYDLGSGLLIDPARFGLKPEPAVPESVAAGVDVTCFSGDKLLGGPQAGIVVGSTSLLDRMKADPLMRALRVDKMTFAALHATLDLFRDPDRLPETHPVIRMMSTSPASLASRAQDLAGRLAAVFSDAVTVTVASSLSEIGGGSLPAQQLPTWVVGLTPAAGAPHTLAEAFRLQDPPVFGRLAGDRFLLDVRTLLPDDPPLIEQAARGVMQALRLPHSARRIPHSI